MFSNCLRPLLEKGLDASRRFVALSALLLVAHELKESGENFIIKLRGHFHTIPNITFFSRNFFWLCVLLGFYGFFFFIFFFKRVILYSSFFSWCGNRVGIVCFGVCFGVWRAFITN